MMMAMVVTAEELSDAEQRVWDAFPSGAPVSFLTGDAENDDPASGKHWDDSRQVRAEVLLELLCGAVEVEPGQAAAVNLQGARVTGAINLREAAFKHALLLDRCYIGDGIALPEAETKSIELRNCHTGPIDVLNAKIGGAFVLTGSRLDGNGGPALAADGLIVTGPMACDGITADGPISLAYASIQGALGLGGAQLDGKDGDAALTLDRVSTADVSAASIVVRGKVSLIGAQIAGSIDMAGARLHNGPGAIAVDAEGASIGAALGLQNADVIGEITMRSGRVGGRIFLECARLENPGKTALRLSRTTVGSDVFCQKMTAKGRVKLTGAQIGSVLKLTGTCLESEAGDVLDLDRISVDNIDLERAHVTGEITMRSGRVGGRIFLGGARLENPGKTALRLSRTTVGSDVFCQKMTAEGRVKLTGAQIGSDLKLTDTRLEIGDAPGGAGDTSGEAEPRTNVALDLEDLQAAEICLWPAKPIKGAVLLSNARVRMLRDKPGCWPEELKLNGLTYDSLATSRTEEDTPKVEERLGWLERNGYHPQPYEQLAAYYRRQGEDRQARRVLLAKQRARRKQYRLKKAGEWFHNGPLKGWGWLQDGLAGYGYAPGRALSLLAVAFVVGWAVFSCHHPPPVNAAHPVFNAALYTLDLLVPAPGLGQASDWDPQGGYLALAAGLHILGWLLAITVIAAITRLFSRS
jgi:hypothetical protein